jgi:hypothetical protein
MMSDYEMFSHDGALEVGLIVTAAKEFGWSWDKVQQELCELAKTPAYDEAMDTAVREAVRRALNMNKTPMRY